MERIGSYEIIRALGEGGVAKVYLCRDAALGREVAVKVLRAGRGASERQLERFRVEAKALAKLRHPNIVTIYAGGEWEGQPFIVMEHVAGSSLQDRLQRQGHLPINEAAILMASLARAVHYIHEQGILHRDLKPDNVLLSPTGQPLLTDFGLAKDFSNDYGMTAPGSGLGTLGYMPPEQIDNALNANALSDVFALGATFYACLTGRRPFAGKMERSIIMNTLAGKYAPVAACRPDAPPPAVDAVVAKAMAKRPEDRYESAEALAQDLIRLTRGEEVSACPPSPRPAPADVLGELMHAPFEVDAFAVDPSSPTLDDESAEVGKLAREGEELFRGGDAERATRTFERALVLAPDDVEVLVRCAVARRKCGDHQGAIRDYERILALRPQDHRAYVGRGMARQDAKDFAGAMDDFRRALKFLPETSSKYPRLKAALRDLEGHIGDSVIRGRNLLGE